MVIIVKRAVLYILICICFLIVVIYLNGIYARVIDNDVELPTDERVTANLKKADGFESHLPLVIVDTMGNIIEKENEAIVEISFIDNENGTNNSLDVPSVKEYAGIKYRGSSSYLTFDKMQYRVELKKDTSGADNINRAVFGMEKSSDWVLNGPFLDRSLSRNYLGYLVAGQLLPWAPKTAYCEVIIDGEYQGLYLLIEPVKKDEGRLDLTDFSLISGKTAYILQTERSGTEILPIETYGTQNGKLMHELSISYPSFDKITKNQYSYIVDDVSRIEKVLYSDCFDDENSGYAKYMDVDAFVDYYIINEFMMLDDAGNLSTFLYKDIHSKLSITAWDFNNSFDNITWIEKPSDEFYLLGANWYRRLLQDRAFVDKVISRYHELRQGVLSDEYLIEATDDNVEYLGSAVDRNFEVWGYTFNEKLLSSDSDGNRRDPKSFEEAIKMLKGTIIERGAFLDNNIEELYDCCIN